MFTDQYSRELAAVCARLEARSEDQMQHKLPRKTAVGNLALRKAGEVLPRPFYLVGK